MSVNQHHYSQRKLFDPTPYNTFSNNILVILALNIQSIVVDRKRTALDVNILLLQSILHYSRSERH